jgi:hypothetical protein
MTLDEAIQRRGFRRWYERQLIEGHVYLAAGILALFATLLAVEVFDYRASFRDIATTLLAALVGAGACLYAIRRFMRLLGRAEYVANQANCPQCRTYARFRLVRAFDAPNALDGRAVKVRCRVCDNEWTIG